MARNRFQLAVYVSLAVCAVSLTVLLAVGCKKEEPIAPPPAPPAVDYGAPLAPAPADTNTVPVAGGALPGPDAGLPSNTSTGQPPVVAAPVPAPPPQELAPVPAPVPTAPAGLKEYTIQKGDSFYSIGKKLGVSWKAIEKANPTVNSSKLKQGDKIMVPEAAAPAAAATPGGAEPAAAATTGKVTHKVVAGDNLTKIASKYHVTPKAIQKANNMTTTRIKVGDKLIIPTKGAPAEAAPSAPPTAPAPIAPPPGTRPA